MNQNHSIPADSGSTRPNTPEEEMMELDEELACLLHNPKADEMCADLLYSAPATPVTPSTRITDVQTTDVGPPPPAAVVAPPLVTDAGAYFWRPRGTFSAGASTSRNVGHGSTVVDTSLTSVSTTLTSVPRVGQVAGTNNIGWWNISPTAGAGRSSEAAEGGRDSAPMDTPPPPTNDRKRKGKKAAVTGCGSEDQIRESTITKQSRIAEVHNRSEKKRRVRINEKMNSLQELVPNCNKADTVSMLDGAFEHMQSLQLQLKFQLQVMQLNFLRCGMRPVMFPGVQPLMTPMGMSMEMGMNQNQNQPMMPFRSGSAASAHSAMSAFPMPPVPLPDPSRTQATSQSNPNLPDQPRIPNHVNPYQQYLGVPQMQIQPQHQSGATSNPSSSSGAENPDIYRPG